MLILLSNNETINTNDLLYVDSGAEGKVYKYKVKAIKVYHDNLYKRILSYDDINRLKDINTRRIILPNNIIYKLKCKIVCKGTKLFNYFYLLIESSK